MEKHQYKYKGLSVEGYKVLYLIYLKNVIDTLETINHIVYTIDGSFKGNDAMPPFTKKGENRNRKPFLKRFDKIVILRKSKVFEKQVKRSSR